MIEKIAMWSGVAGIIIAIFAIVILYLTRSNIIDLLDRDVVMYDKNYEIKKEALHEAFNCLDVISQNGLGVKNNAQYIQRAKDAYNGLLCTLTSPKLYQAFYRMAIDNTVSDYSIEDIEKFKIDCRKELITHFKKKGEMFKGTTDGALNDNSNLIPSAPQPAQPVRPVQPQPKPAQPRPTQPAQRPQPRPQGQVPPKQD